MIPIFQLLNISWYRYQSKISTLGMINTLIILAEWMRMERLNWYYLCIFGLFDFFKVIDFWLILDQYPTSISDWDSPKWGYHVGTRLIGLNRPTLMTQCEWQCSPCPLSLRWMSWITSFFTPLTHTMRKTPISCCIKLHCQQPDTWQVELFGQDPISKHWTRPPPPPPPTHTLPPPPPLFAPTPKQTRHC